MSLHRALVALLVGSAAAFSLKGAARLTTSLRAPMGLLTMAEDEAAAAGPLASDIWTSSSSVKVQGSTLKTWDIGEEATQRVQLSLRSSGRPIDANVELWHTPSYIPTKFRIYTENGESRPVDAIIETPKHPKTVAVYNTGSMEFPFDATVANTGLGKAYDSLSTVDGALVQGGQITSYTFPAHVESVQVLLKTNERNMKALIELTQGPNQVKQFIEVYASVGYKNPFYCVIQTPGSNNAIRIINQNTVEFPFDAWVLPYETGASTDADVVMGGGGMF